MPGTWFYKFFEIHDDIGLYAIWGYDELVFSAEHYDDLLEQEQEGVYLFYTRKKKLIQLARL